MNEDLTNYPSQMELKKFYAEYYELEARDIMLGYGSDDLIHFLFWQYSDCSFYIDEYAYPMIKEYVKSFKIGTKGKSADVHYYAIKQLQDLPMEVQSKTLILDCAYMSDKESFKTLKEDMIKLSKTNSVFVICSMSKVLRLPGLRAGCMFYSDLEVSRLEKYRPGYSTHNFVLSTLKECLK